MLYKNTLVATIAVLFAGQAIGSAVAAVPQPQIATNSLAACNCPNNCDHRAGSSCKYYSGPSDTSKVISGHCAGNPLKCV